MFWPDDPSDNSLLFIDTLHTIFKHKNSKRILQELSQVHPVSLEEVPGYLLEALETKYAPQITDLSQKYKKPRSAIQRLLLVLQCSCFSSGIYLNFSIFNHSCRPNAIKFQPENSNESQVRATQLIKKGTEVTISYIDPREQTYGYRARVIREQFGFEPDPKDFKDQLLEKFRAEKPSQEDMKYVESLENQLNQLPEDNPLQELIDIRKEALQILDPRHILILRLNRMILKEISPLLQEGEEENEQEDVNFGENLLIFLQTAWEVYQTQLIWISKDHIDFATTYSDISMGLQSLLSWDQKMVFQNFPLWNTFTKASKFQLFCDQTFEKIHKMYQ
uniref:SET domain-containing protein n=1 Tax=Arcella intermedia TaxID=1963864 RepID=A0A6B2L6Z6_9EUKA